MQTTTRPPTHEPTALPESQPERRAVLAALLVLTGAAIVTAAWIYLLVVVAAWIISALF